MIEQVSRADRARMRLATAIGWLCTKLADEVRRPHINIRVCPDLYSLLCKFSLSRSQSYRAKTCIAQGRNLRQKWGGKVL